MTRVLLQRSFLLLFSLRVWLRLAMAAFAAEMSTAEMSTAETAAESTAVRYAKPVMEPSTAKTVMIKVSFMIEAVMPVTPQAAVVVPVGRVAIRSVIARAVHASGQANHRDKQYC
jgi:hypothetical protein